MKGVLILFSMALSFSVWFLGFLLKIRYCFGTEYHLNIKVKYREKV